MLDQQSQSETSSLMVNPFEMPNTMQIDGSKIQWSTVNH